MFNLRVWLAGSHLAVFLFPILLLMLSGALAQDLRNQTRWDLDHQGVIIAMMAADFVAHGRQSNEGTSLESLNQMLSPRLNQIKKSTLSGIRITDARGVVVATSGQLLGEDLSGDEEVAQALLGTAAGVVRPRNAPTRMPIDSESRRAHVRLFVAVPILLDDELLGTVVLSRTPRDELQAIYKMSPTPLRVGTLLSLLATLGFGLYAGFLLTRSLRAVTQTTREIAEGRFEHLGVLDTPRSSHVADVAGLAGAVQTMAIRLQRRLSYISEFASNVSHEFKTPLATLRGTIELLADDDDMPPEQRQRFLQNAEAELLRLQDLVDGLLLLARAEEGGGRSPVQIRALLEGAESRHPGVCFEVCDAQVLANQSQINAVLDNLIRNAQLHGAAPVSVVARVVGTELQIEVQDAGPGISAANLARVFDRFFTTRRGDGGTGLGLALVRAVVLAHGGEASARSEPGETVFTVMLPTVEPA